MASIIRLHAGRHDEIRSLLPWYVTGRLDAAEHARVAAHVSTCRECQADLEFERRLEVEVAIAPIDVEHGWASMQRRITAAPAPRSGGAFIARLRELPGRLWRAGPPWLSWALAAQAALLVVAGALTVRTAAPVTQPARYHALSSVPAAATGNVVVIFRPDTRESAMRQALVAADAHLIDGPTAADAYVLHVPAAERAGAMAGLRARHDVVLAQPLDPGGSS
jgi:anti-sigma factor RsiW